MTETHEKTVETARRLTDALRASGHNEQASAFQDTLHQPHKGRILLLSLRETCQTVLTAIEAIDPVCAAMIEELRLEVDTLLRDR